MRSRSRVHRGSVSVDTTVDIDLEEVLEAVSDEALRAECQQRGFAVSGAADATSERVEDFEVLAADLRAAFLSGDAMHGEVLLLRLRAMTGLPRPSICKPTAASLFAE